MENSILNKTAIGWLYETARWTRFLAILGFVFIGFMIMAAVVIGPVLTFLNADMGLSAASPKIASSVIAAIYGVLAIIYFFPVYYLHKFSQGTITAYKTEDEEKLNASLYFLKKHFKFIGILLIAVLALYLIIFLISMFALISGLI